MSFATQFQAAQSMALDSSPAAGQPLHSNLFRPPPSPDGSSYNLAKSTGSLFSEISMSTPQHAGLPIKRKRASTRGTSPQGWRTTRDGAHDAHEERAREFRYTLAGQISTTPGSAPAGAENGVLDDSVYSDVDYRRALGPKADLADSPPLGTSPPSGTTAPAPPQLIPWNLFSLQTLGDMVGKVWEFCKTGAFKGFRAGGGQAYNQNGTTVTETAAAAAATEIDEKSWAPESEPPPPPPPADECPPAVYDTPGCFAQPAQPQPPSYSAHPELDTPEPTPEPAVKRRQVSANNDELRNWVVVDDEPGEPAQPRRFAAEVKAAAAGRPGGLVRPRTGYYSQVGVSSHRRISAPSQRFGGSAATLTRGMAARPPLRLSHATASPASPPSLYAPREPASFASPRASPASRSTPSRIPVAVPSPSHPGPQQSYNPNPFAFSTPTPARPASPAPSVASLTLRSSTTASRPSSRQSLSRGPAGRSPTSRHSLGGSLTLSGGGAASSNGVSKPLRAGSPPKLASGHRRNQSSSTGIPRASLRLAKPKPEHVIEAVKASPRLDAEAKHLAKRRLAAEMDADAKVDAFNARLLSMIRQGKEALGTKVEVEDVSADVDMDMDMDMEGDDADPLGPDEYEDDLDGGGYGGGYGGGEEYEELGSAGAVPVAGDDKFPFVGRRRTTTMTSSRRRSALVGDGGWEDDDL
ncbi:hypothetical protein VTJ83DRAFT_4514 [Remersonia thermophila]|uniref:Uncharacterized protein n=1 Tax=Remersonia thermophila TaxID=72144 RepID=A0ABR4DAE2_9PEZI